MGLGIRELSNLVRSGAVSFDGEVVTDPHRKFLITGTHIIKVGKHKFYKIVLKENQNENSKCS